MNEHDKRVLTLSAPAPELDEDDSDDLAGLTEDERAQQARMDELCAAYGDWCRTRSFFGPPPVNSSVLGRLTAKTRVRKSTGGPDAACSSELFALHIAVIAQPEEALDRKVFVLHYLYRIGSVKAAAHALDISRNHWYRLLRAFRSRVVAAAKAIESDNLAAAKRLPTRQQNE